MKNISLEFNKKVPMIAIILLTFLVIMSVATFLIFIQDERMKNDQEYAVTIAYYNMIDEIEEYANENISLIEGLSAYIQTTNNYQDIKINDYLRYLVGDKLNAIRNVSVLKDTTIQWVYPLEGNRDAIGVDLSKIPAQAKEIQLVKNDLIQLFVGPVNLVQGGTGFIVRIPLLKNNAYWGMVSIVLRSEVTFSFIREFSDKNQVEFLITHAEDNSSIIFGEKSILNKNPLMFNTKETFGGWDIYVIPKNGWSSNLYWKAIVYLVAFIISLIASVYIIRWTSHYSSTIDSKNVLEEKYIRDRFTGIFTRDYFNNRAREEFSHAIRNKQPLSMVYFDLDHFKEANDNHGHLKGDEILLSIVDKVNTIIRNEDVFARWGGDEFIILMPETDLSSTEFISERIRREVESLEICKSLNVTISIGCSQWVENEYLESWFLRTDEALYKSKNNGKNRVTVSEPDAHTKVLLRIEWLQKWNCGNKIIDKEHRSLMNRCNMLIESSLSRSTTDGIVKNIEYFFDELRNHFRDEILILEKAKYPKLEMHKQEHDNILNEGNRFFKLVMNNELPLIDLYSFLIDRIIKGHLVLKDRDYFDYL